MWRDIETVNCPDLPAAMTATPAEKRAAKAPAREALKRWQDQQDRQDRSYVSTQVLPRSEYRVKYRSDGRAVIQMRPA